MAAFQQEILTWDLENRSTEYMKLDLRNFERLSIFVAVRCLEQAIQIL